MPFEPPPQAMADAARHATASSVTARFLPAVDLTGPPLARGTLVVGRGYRRPHDHRALRTSAGRLDHAATGLGRPLRRVTRPAPAVGGPAGLGAGRRPRPGQP